MCLSHHDDVVSIDFWIRRSSCANRLQIKHGRHFLIVHRTKDDDVLDIRGVRSAMRGGDRLLQRHLSRDRINARLLDFAVNGHRLLISRLLDVQGDLRVLEIGSRCSFSSIEALICLGR